MPVSYSFNGRIIRLDCIGEYTSDDVRGAYAAALQDPACPPNTVFLLDVTHSTSLANRPSEDIRETAYFWGSQPDMIDTRCAIIAPIDLYYGLMRMASMIVEEYGVKTEVFRTEEEALKWLED